MSNLEAGARPNDFAGHIALGSSRRGGAKNQLRAACLFLATMLAGLSAPALAPDAQICPERPDVFPAPQALQPKIAEAFGVPAEAAGHAMARCAGTTLLACIVGANLNCGKADARRSLPGATAWCRGYPDADSIPMYVTGHATIYAWRCVGAKAVPAKAVVTVDPQGFVAENWKEIP
jgi:hypothetical protein